MKKLLFALALAILVSGNAFAAGVTPFACPITIVTTGGTAVLAIPSRVNGGIIVNPSNASESLFVDQTKTATTTSGATNYALAAGQSWFVIPGSSIGISVNAVTSAHSFFCVMW